MVHCPDVLTLVFSNQQFVLNGANVPVPEIILKTSIK